MFHVVIVVAQSASKVENLVGQVVGICASSKEVYVSSWRYHTARTRSISSHVVRAIAVVGTYAPIKSIHNRTYISLHLSLYETVLLYRRHAVCFQVESLRGRLMFPGM